ncbi:MAG: HMA2 domain-containing protein, partial [Desulfomonilaceae bacterium]
MIREIHNTIEGRVRFKVKGLYRSEHLKRTIESRLPECNFVYSVSANVLTGNVLVRFDPTCNNNLIFNALEDIVLSWFSHLKDNTENKELS